MTRPAGSKLVRAAQQCALVLDGNTVKLRLTAERAHSGSLVHVDWLRFTVARRRIETPDVEVLFPSQHGGDWAAYERLRELHRILQSVPDCDQGAGVEAVDLATQVAEALGPDFVVIREPRKGHDFYRHRIAIERAGAEVGWVGFQASSDSPRQQAQSRTVHCNLFGAACTFAAPGWNQRLASLVDAWGGTITRCDLALDFFDGYAGGIERVKADYEAGKLDVSGKRLKANMVGDWTASSLGARSFYVGSKEAGKQTNAYEKGDQLFGVDAGSKWLRFELRYGNKLRELPVDMLRRPADFFAGASEWHASVLAEAQATVQAEPVKCKGRLPLQTAEAECYRSARHALVNAGPTLAALFRFAEVGFLETVIETTKRPARLARFTAAELTRGYAAALRSILPVGGAGPVPV